MVKCVSQLLWQYWKTVAWLLQLPVVAEYCPIVKNTSPIASDKRVVSGNAFIFSPRKHVVGTH